MDKFPKVKPFSTYTRPPTEEEPRLPPTPEVWDKVQKDNADLRAMVEECEKYIKGECCKVRNRIIRRQNLLAKLTAKLEEGKHPKKNA